MKTFTIKTFHPFWFIQRSAYRYCLFLFIFAGLSSCKKNVDQQDQSRPIISSAVANTLTNPKVDWIFDEKPTAQTEKSRLKTSLMGADFSPVGLRVISGAALSIQVDALASSAALPQLIVGSYDRGTVSTYTLQVGANTIRPTNAGDLYIRYASTAPAGGRIRVRFNSGYLAMPFYTLGVTTHQNWLDMLAADTSATSLNAILVGKRTFLVVSKAKAIQYQNENQDLVLSLLDTAMKAEDDLAGMDNSSAANAVRKLPIMVTERTSGYMDATSYRIRIVSSSINRVLRVSDIQTNGWGVFHEYGHQHQMYQWTWGAVGEVVPNIYTLAARRVVQPTTPGLNATQWNTVTTYLARPDDTRVYESSAADLTTRLALFHQLYLAFGNDFYIRLHKFYRENTLSIPNDDEEKRQFMINSSKICGKNLSDFFMKWGFTVPETVYAELAALGLPAPETDLTTLRD